MEGRLVVLTLTVRVIKTARENLNGLSSSGEVGTGRKAVFQCDGQCFQEQY